MTGPGPVPAGSGSGGIAAVGPAGRWPWSAAARHLYLTPRGLAAVGLMAACGVASLAGRIDLVPLVGALAAPVLTGPVVAVRRAVRARASVTVRTCAHPVLVPVGGTAVLEVTAFDHGARGAPVLGV